MGARARFDSSRETRSPTEPCEVRGAFVLHPSVRLLTEQRGGELAKAGFYHALTGFAYELHLQFAVDFESRFCRWLEASPDALVQLMLDQLVLVESTRPQHLLETVAEHTMFVPAHNPCLVSGAGQPAMLYRPEHLSTCTLPRTGHAPTVIREELPDPCVRLLQLAGDNARVGDFATGDAHTAWAALSFLTDPDRQLVRTVQPGRKVPPLKAAEHYPVQNFVRTKRQSTASDHYSKLRPTVQWNFDWVEPTVAHALRFPCQALDGQSYGGRLFASIRRLFDDRAAPNPVCALEVGGGTGVLAREFLTAQRHTDPAWRIDYTILDISPGMIEQQRRALDEAGLEVTHESGDAQQRLPGDKRYDLILANEVIADFRVERDPDGAPVQSGSRAFLQHLRRALRPGGYAVVIEYGSRDTPPRPVDHLDHVEHSVDFEDLVRHAQALGLTTRLSSLGEFLRIDGQVPMLVGQQERALCMAALMEDRGEQAEFRAWSRDEFAQRFPDAGTGSALYGLTFAPFDEGLHFGPDAAQFLVLVLGNPQRT